MSVGTWLPPSTAGGTVAPAARAVPRVIAADPGAFLDGEPWTFSLVFKDPGTGNTTDLTGSRLYVKLSYANGFALTPIQTLDSAADDGSIVIAPGTGGRATFTAYPENRNWTAPFLGQGLIAQPALVYGHIYREVGYGEPVGLTQVTLRVLPSTGAPAKQVGPLPVALVGQVTGADVLGGAITVVGANSLSGAFPAPVGPRGTATVTPMVGLNGAISATASLTAGITITPTVPLVGQIPGAAVLNGSATVTAAGTVALQGAITGSGVLTGATSQGIALSGTVASSATLGGNVLIAIGVSGSVPGAGTQTGSLTVVAAQPISGSIPAPTGPAGGASVAGVYAGSVTGSGSLSGMMTVSVALSGSVPGGGTLSGTMTTIPATNLTGSVPGSGALTGAMTTSVALTGSVPRTAALSGSMTTVAPANLNGAIPGPVGPQGSATLTAGGLVNARKGRLAAATAA